ncbi:MAG: hypothetical protein V1717_00525 [Candidatus Micrarchaeota archaeon]
MQKKSQASLEYVSILLLLFLALIPVMYIGYRDLNAKNSVAQAKAVALEITSVANQLRAQGQGSRMYVQIAMPENVDSASLNGTEVILKVRNPDGILTDVFATANANLSGSLPSKPGVYVLNVTVLGNGNVSVSTQV